MISFPHAATGFAIRNRRSCTGSSAARAPPAPSGPRSEVLVARAFPRDYRFDSASIRGPHVTAGVGMDPPSIHLAMADLVLGHHCMCPRLRLSLFAGLSVAPEHPRNGRMCAEAGACQRPPHHASPVRALDAGGCAIFQLPLLAGLAPAVRGLDLGGCRFRRQNTVCKVVIVAVVLFVLLAPLDAALHGAFNRQPRRVPPFRYPKS